MREQYSAQYPIMILLICAFVMYVLPWTLNNNAVLSLGAYDFAEFLAKRQFDGTSYTTLLALRGQLVFLTWLFAFSIRHPLFTMTWWIKATICLLLVVAQLPPLTFISNIADINQQQQTLLSLNSLIGVGFGLTGLLWSAKNSLRLSISIVGLMTTIYGLSNALKIITIYSDDARIGFGGIGLVVIYTIIGISSLWKMYRA